MSTTPIGGVVINENAFIEAFRSWSLTDQGIHQCTAVAKLNAEVTAIEMAKAKAKVLVHAEAVASISMRETLQTTIGALNKAANELRNSTLGIENASEELTAQAAVLLFGPEIGTPDFMAMMNKAEEHATVMAMWCRDMAILARDCMALSRNVTIQADNLMRE